MDLPFLEVGEQYEQRTPSEEEEGPLSEVARGPLFPSGGVREPPFSGWMRELLVPFQGEGGYSPWGAHFL